MLKALHIIDSFGMGGAETWLLQVCKYLQLHPEKKLQIDFLATGGKKAILDDEVLATGSKIFYIKYSLKKIFSFRREFLKILNKHQYDVIHNHQDFIAGWHLLAACGSWPRVRLMHLHNPYNFVHNYLSSPGRYFSYYMGRMLSAICCNKLTGTSDHVMNQYNYHKWPYKKIRVSPAYCGFNVEKFKYSVNTSLVLQDDFFIKKQNEKIGLFVGRIGLQSYDLAVNQKNPDFAFQVALHLCKQNANWKFAFAGYKGKKGKDFEEIVQKEGLKDKIKFLGIRKDIPALMKISDILLFPSFWEGLGMVAVEAQATGLKVIASASLPKEAIVVPKLVELINLNQPLPYWIKKIVENTPNYPRGQAYKIVKSSSFSLENSVQMLLHIYKKK